MDLKNVSEDYENKEENREYQISSLLDRIKGDASMKEKEKTVKELKKVLLKGEINRSEILLLKNNI